MHETCGESMRRVGDRVGRVNSTIHSIRHDGRLSRRRLIAERSKLEWKLDELITKNFSNNENRKLAEHIIDHRKSILTYL